MTGYDTTKSVLLRSFHHPRRAFRSSFRTSNSEALRKFACFGSIPRAGA